MRSLLLGVVSVTLLAASSAMAQQASPATRIVNPIDEKQLVVIRGTVHPLANATNDRGAAPDSTPLNRIHLLLKRSAGQQASLDQLMGQLHTPGNPNYHKWLTPDRFGNQFGPSDQDIATVETWLTGHGFNVIGVKPGKQVIEFSGNVGQFRGAFHTQIHQYSVNGESHFANAANPQIPAALAPVVGGFVSLNNFHAQSEVKELGKAMYDPSTHTATADWTWGTATGGVNFVLAPQDYAVEYDLNALYNATTPINGAGQTIAIINASNVNIDLVNQFRKLFSLPVNPPQVIIDGNDPGVNGDAVEAYLDVEWAGAVAPDATIDLVIGANTELESGLYLAAEHAVYGNVAPVMSMSFGYCELGAGSSNAFWNGLWEQAAAQGATVMVSSGDAGSAGCDNDNSQYYAVYGQNVNGFASTPFNVAVGGTDFYYSFWNASNVSLSDFAPYWNTTPQPTPAVSLKAYLTEQPWNASQFGDDLSQTFANSSGAATSIAAGSGGASNCATGTGATNNGWTTCTAGYPKPSWQTGSGVPADKVRDLPDVSLFASSGSNYTFYPICASDGDCQPATGGNLIQIFGVGGTSASSPSFAGMMALVNQKYGPQGQANYVLYPLAKQYPAAFHDVTEGSNAVPCAIASTDCITAPSGLGYTITDPTYGTSVEGEIGAGSTPEYNAATGYDLASGLGTIDANQMVTNWGNVRVDTSTTTLTVTPASFAHGTAPAIGGTVSGTGTPTGDVALVTNSTEPVNQGETFFTLSGGAYSNNTVNYLPGGTYDVWAQYGGDGANGLSMSTPVKITVNPENSELSLSIYDNGATISSGTSITYGTLLTLDALAGPSSCTTGCPASYTYPTGTVAFSDNGTAVNTAVINSEGDAEYTLPTAFNAGSHSITAAYSGDGSYNSSSAAAIGFTVTKATPTVAIANSYGAPYNAGQTTTLSIGVESNSSGAAPLGAVTIAGAPTGTPTSATLVAGVDPISGATVGLVTVTIPATAGVGTYNITVTYNPNTASAVNYTTASSTYQVQIIGASGTATTTTGTASAAGTSPNALVTVTGTVTAASGAAPAGTVYFMFAAVYNGVFQDVYFSSEVATLVAGTGSSSTYSMTFGSGSLPQGVNQITIQYVPASGSSDDPSTAVVTIGNPLADFSLIANTTIIPVVAGNSGSTNIDLASANTFAGAVSLTCTVPTAWTCSIPSSETLTSGGFAVAALSVTAPKTATVGKYNVLITGKDSATGEYVHTLGLNAQVTGMGPGFALTNSGSITVSPGATTGNTSTITATPSNGFTGAVNLTCLLTNPPGGIVAPTCTVTTSVTISGTTAATGTLTIDTTSSTTPGAYTMTVTGTDAATGKITSSTAVGLTVNPPPGFALTNNGPISFIAGASTGNVAAITVTPVGGFTGTVDLTCAVTATPASPTSPATCSVTPTVDPVSANPVAATVTVSTTASTTLGSYTATVTGTDMATGKLTSSTAVSVTVLGVPGFGLTNNGPITFGAGLVTGNTATITVVPVNNFTSSVALACAVTTAISSPTDAPTCSLGSPAVAGGSGTDVLTLASKADTTPGAYTVTVTGTAGAITETTMVSATVSASYSASSGTVTPASVSPGGSATSTITVTSGDDYAGTVTIACSLTASPSGASDLPTCLGPSQPITLSSTTTSGTGTVTVNTTAATTGELVYPRPGGKGWLDAGGGAILAFLVFLGIPARRRSWRAMLGMLVLLAALGSLSACGGGGGCTSNCGGGNPGTTAGAYTFTVTATGNPAQGTGNTTTFTVTVN